MPTSIERLMKRQKSLFRKPSQALNPLMSYGVNFRTMNVMWNMKMTALLYLVRSNLTEVTWKLKVIMSEFVSISNGMMKLIPAR